MAAPGLEKQPTGKPASKTDKRFARTPLVLQMHAAECGAACLGSILAHFGYWAPLSELREKCEVSRDGSSAAGLLRAARFYGLECSGKQASRDQLRKMPLPAILFWEFRHFVILEGFDGDSWLISDPSSGKRKISDDEFAKDFSGIALQFSTGPDFRTGGSRRDILKQVGNWIENSGRLLAGAGACGLMLALLALIVPASLGSFTDRVLAGGETLGAQLAAVLAGAGAVVYCLALLKQRLLERLTVRMSVTMSDRLVSRMLRLPAEFFNHRMVGDLSQRFMSIDKIARNLANQFVSLLIEGAMSLVFLAAMLFYDGLLTGIVLGFAALNAGFGIAMTRLGAEHVYGLRREQGLLAGIGMQMLDHAENLRMTASDSMIYSHWSGQQAMELDKRQRVSAWEQLGASLSGLVAALGGVAVLAAGAIQVMAGEFTLGALLAFYVLAAMFLAPLGRFVEFANQRQTLETDMQRVEDLAVATEDSVFAHRDPQAESILTVNGRLQLVGQVELRNVTFGYNRSKPPLIKDFNLVIKPGQRLAIVGPSGSGKSTISRLVAGLNEPWSGEILFDGKQRHEIPEEVLSRSISMVDQDAVLFSGTVRDNITLWNPAVPDEAIVAAARGACIHEDILRRPKGYSTMVEEGGVNFSGGQRQRLEIARALVSNPTVIILDEATSALDAATEEFVDDALRQRGVTCLIIAHRLSTVRDCDEIIVLEKGVEVQRGAHDALITDETGTYHKLVKSS